MSEMNAVTLWFVHEYVAKHQYENLLINLLAIMNNDGGDYTVRHGIEKSIYHAMSNHFELIEKSNVTR